MPKRATMNISVPASVREWIDERVSEGGYGSASEYVRELVRQDRERHAMQRLEQQLLEGVASGPAVPMTTEDWKELRREVVRRVGKRTVKRG